MANVKLSKEEFELVTDARFILTKNRITGKVYEMFGLLSEEFTRNSEGFPPEVRAVNPKISKGENYLALPWVMLDYPRFFSKTDVFAIRCFFWWGNFFSITLQLSGIYQQRYAEAIEGHLTRHPSGWWISNSADPWSHHFTEENYIPYSSDCRLVSSDFIKVAKKIPLQQWDNSLDFFSRTFLEMRVMLGS